MDRSFKDNGINDDTFCEIWFLSLVWSFESIDEGTLRGVTVLRVIVRSMSIGVSARSSYC